ncbi:MAG: asparagine--tRNA ligase [Planctomycetaceae bacterium]|nr:asparagine--tRNA ligase [Planctomycetaceae bacterium]
MAEAKKAYINQLGGFEGHQVRLDGWLYNNRPSGKVQFLMVRDGTGLCQCVLEAGAVDEETFEQVKRLGQESSLSVTGLVRAEPRSPGGYELAASGVKIHNAASDYPITPKEHGIDFLLKNRHLHLRSMRPWAIGRVRHTVIDAIRRFFNDNGFTLVDTPIFTTIAGEGEQTLFEVDYFGQPLHLSQTGQLYLESAAMSFGRVYCFGPTFRAEKSKTRRHLTEFWMVEPEVAYIDLNGLLELAENFVFSIIKRVLTDNRPELEALGRDLKVLESIEKPFVRMTYTEAAELLTSDKTQQFMAEQLEGLKREKAAFDKELAEIEAAEAKGGLKKWQQEKNARRIPELRAEIAELETKIENNPKHAKLASEFRWGKDLGGSDETIISQMYDRPIFVTHYPRGAKAFYMRQDRDNEQVVENFDLLAPAGFGEIIGGSVREDDYERLLARIRQEGYNPESYQWYLDLRRYGSVPHGGFGLGVERTVAWLTGEKHIRQCIAFPRMMDKVYL